MWPSVCFLFCSLVVFVVVFWCVCVCLGGGGGYFICFCFYWDGSGDSVCLLCSEGCWSILNMRNSVFNILGGGGGGGDLRV